MKYPQDAALLLRERRSGERYRQQHYADRRK
jgi:hypothetical protein